MELAAAYFGDIPAGEPPAPVPCAPARAIPARRLIEDRVELPRLYLGWLSPAMYADGDAELDLLGDVLATGKASRLYRSLVTTAGLPPTSRPTRARVNSAARFKSWPPPCRVSDSA